MSHIYIHIYTYIYIHLYTHIYYIYIHIYIYIERERYSRIPDKNHYFTLLLGWAAVSQLSSLAVEPAFFRKLKVHFREISHLVRCGGWAAVGHQREIVYKST